jgi:hypothetical protein
VAGAISQTAAQAGDQNAKEWLLDLKQVALDVKDEQMQATMLLQAIHQFVSESHDQLQQQVRQYQQMAPQQAPMGMGGRGGLLGGGGGGGLFGGLLGGGFGRAMAMRAGFGRGDDLISNMFN